MGMPTGRQAEIIRELKQSQRMSVTDLARRLDTSEVTIRRDLAELESVGLLRRVRGGAVSTMLRGEELPFAMRELEYAEEKQRIAAAAVALIADGESAFPGKGNPPAHEEELRRLRAENKRLLMERDILKKATAFFARESS